MPLKFIEESEDFSFVNPANAHLRQRFHEGILAFANRHIHNFAMAPRRDIHNFTITKKALDAGYNYFASHYSVIGGNPGFAKEISVSLKSFVNIITSSNIPPGDLALRFIHRFDTTAQRWYLCLECCTMTLSSTEDGYNLYNVTSLPAPYRFDLKIDGSILRSTLAGDFDANYVNNFRSNQIHPHPSVDPIDVNKHIMSVIFPWKCEILQMVKDNLIDPANIGEDLQIVFKSSSSNFSMMGDISKITYPHGLVIYLHDSTYGDYIDDTKYLSSFYNKGINFSTLWPPKTNQYVWIDDLPLCP